MWSGHKRKREHGVGVVLEGYQEHLPARIISLTIFARGMRLAILNVYAADDTKSDSSKIAFIMR